MCPELLALPSRQARFQKLQVERHQTGDRQLRLSSCETTITTSSQQDIDNNT